MRGDNEILDFDSNNISNILWKLYNYTFIFLCKSIAEKWAYSQ